MDAALFKDISLIGDVGKIGLLDSVFSGAALYFVQLPTIRGTLEDVDSAIQTPCS